MIRLLSLFLILISASNAQALTGNIGGATAQFLRIGAGARALGMGDAYSAIAEGPTAIYWNPAGLGHQTSPEVAYSHVEMIGFIHHEYLAYTHPIELLRGTIGTAITLYNEDQIDRITNTNKQVGTFKNHSEVFALSYGTSFNIGEDWGMSDRSYFNDLWRVSGAEMPLQPEEDVWNGNLALGVSLKTVRSTLNDRSANAFAADGGALFRHQYLPNLTLSFAFRNVGTKMKFIQESESLPTEVAFGASFNQQWGRQRLLPAAEITLPYFGLPTLNLGTEYSFPVGFDSIAAIRAGYKSLQAHELNPIAGLTGGVGFAYRHVVIHMAFQPMAVLGETFRIETGYRF